jgi:hypothetical protein
MGRESREFMSLRTFDSHLAFISRQTGKALFPRIRCKRRVLSKAGCHL